MSVDGEGVYEPTFLGRAGRKGDLIIRLNALHKSLNELGQDQNELPKGLQSTATQLVSAKILGHSDKDVRLLSVCCILDVLKAFAPEAPYGDDDLVRIFEVIISQIRSLSTYDIGSTTGKKVAYILESLSTVKSCVIPVILVQTGVPGAEDLMTSLFDALISVFKPEHTEDVSNHMCSILQACIEECDDIDQDLLDILLSPLLPSSKAENPMSYKCVGNVLRSTSACIQASVSAFINHVLVGTAIPGKAKTSELADHIYPLIFELHKIQPQLLLRVLPNICVQLQAEEEDIRLKAVKLLGQLFSSNHADYATEFSKNFRDFLGRFNDLSSLVRLEMVDSGSLIMKRKVQHKAAIEEHLATRVKDGDVDVRLGAIGRLIELGTESPDNLSKETFLAIGQRLSDKKLEVRKLVLVGLSRLYYRHVSSALPTLSSLCRANKDSQDGSLSDEPYGPFSAILREGVLEKLGFIPSYVVKCWGYNEMRNLVLQLLQENILPKTVMINDVTGDSDDNSQPQPKSNLSRSNASKRSSLSAAITNTKAKDDLDACRASALLLLFTLLSPDERNSFGTILGHKTKVRNDLLSFLQAHTDAASEASGGAGGGGGISDLKRSMAKLITALPPNDMKTKTSLLEKLHMIKDKTVFRLLSRTGSPKDDLQSACEHRDDLKQRLDSKSALGEYVGNLYDSAGYMIANQSVVSSLLAYTHGAGSYQSAIVATLLTMLAKHFSQAFSGSAFLLEEWLQDCNSLVTTAATAFDNIKAKNKDKKRATPGASLAVDAARDEVDDAYFLLQQSVSTIQYVASVLGNFSTKGGGGTLTQGGDDKLAEYRASAEKLCNTLIKLAMKQSSFELCIHLAETATQLAICSEQADFSDDSGKKRGAPSSSSSSSGIMSIVTTAINSLSSRKLDLSNRRLPYDLSVLSALVNVPTSTKSTIDLKKLYLNSSLFATASGVKERVIEFIKEEMLVEGFQDRDGYGTVGEAVSAALKLWSAFITAEEDYKEREINKKNAIAGGDNENDEGDEDDGEEDMSQDLGDLVKALFDCIEVDGASVCGCEIDGSAERSLVFETAACCAIKLLRLTAIGDFLDVEKWHRLGWTFITNHQGTRKLLSDTLNSLIQTAAVHPRFLAYPCLLATDDALVGKAGVALRFAVRRLRHTHDSLCGRAMIEDSNHLRALAEMNMPEALLPYVLHLLSYHPDFPTSSSVEDEASKRRLRGITKNVRMVTDNLLDSVVQGEDNLSYLLKQVNIISQNYVDATDPDNIGLNFVTIVASKILSERIRNVDDVKANAGDVKLPPDLFRLKKESSRGGRVGDALIEADSAIDKVLHSKGGRGQVKKGKAPGRGPAGLSGRVGATAGRPPGAKNKVAATISEDDDNDEDKITTKRKVEKKAKPVKAAKRVVAKEEPQRVSSRHSGGGRVSVDYNEKDESDDEVERWENAAAEISNSQLSRGSASSGGKGGKSSPRGREGSSQGLDHANSSDAEDEDEDGGSDDDDVYAFKSSIPAKTSNSDSLKRKSISSALGAGAGAGGNIGSKVVNTKGKAKQSSSGRASYDVDSDAGSGFGDEVGSVDRGEEAQSFEREEEDSLESYPNKRRSSVKAEVKVPIVGKTDTSQKGTKKPLPLTKDLSNKNFTAQISIPQKKGGNKQPKIDEVNYFGSSESQGSEDLDLFFPKGTKKVAGKGTKPTGKVAKAAPKVIKNTKADQGATSKVKPIRG